MSGRHLVVGSAECQISDILNTIRSTPPINFAPMHEKWSILATELGVPNATVKTVRGRILLSVYTVEEAVHDILECWVAGHVNATLDILVNALEGNGIGMRNHASALKDRFYTETPPQSTNQPPSRAGGVSTGSVSSSVGPAKQMNRDHFDRQIRIHLPELQRRTKLYPSVIAYLSSKYVLSEDDEQDLRAERTEGARNTLFYKLIKIHGPTCYAHLVKAFEEQNGVSEILRQFNEEL